jgi:hypothetical protein
MASVDYSEHNIQAKQCLQQAETLIRKKDLSSAVSKIEEAIAELRLMRGMLIIQQEK